MPYPCLPWIVLDDNLYWTVDGGGEDCGELWDEDDQEGLLDWVEDVVSQWTPASSDREFQSL